MTSQEFTSCVTPDRQNCPGILTMHVHAAFGVGCGPITHSTNLSGLKTPPEFYASRNNHSCGFGYGFGHVHLPGMDCVGNIDLNESGGHFLKIVWPARLKVCTVDGIFNYITGEAAERADRLAVELAVANERADNLAAELAALRAAIGRKKLNRVPADVPAAPADAIVAPVDAPAKVPAGEPASVMVAGTKHAAE
jgi:hypothetical protein